MNKCLIFFLVLFITSTGLLAQTGQGNMMLGGGFEFRSTAHQSGGTSDQNSFSFSPSFGYFISDNLAIGASLSIGTSRTGTGAGKTITNSFSFGPFARYYLFPGDGKFALFGEAGLAFGTHKTDPAFGNVSRGNQIRFALSPGATYFFNEHWGLELQVGGLAITSSDPDTDNDNDKYTEVSFGLSSLAPSLGIRYHF